MIKNMKNKIAIIFILFMMLMPILLTCQSYAQVVDEKHIEPGIAPQSTYTYQDLASMWEILCGQKGQHIPSLRDIQYATDGTNSIATSSLGSNEATYNALRGKKYMSEEIAYYVVIANRICDVTSAYVLNYADENVGVYPSEVQAAWWTTPANRSNQTNGNNKLSLTASAYRDFVKKIVKDPDGVDNTAAYKPLQHTYEDGTTVQIMFPELDVKSKVGFHVDDMAVSYSEERHKYMLGPCTLSYVNDSYEDIEFGLLDKFDIYTNISTEALDRSKWRFVYPSKHDDTKKYPDPGEKFYIEMDYIQGVTKVTGIDIDYKYLICGGEYKELQGTYDKFRWTCSRKCVASGSCSDPNHSHQWKYTLKAKKQNLALESQTLDLTEKAARWYETEKIRIKLNESTLKIRKKALDENGNELSSSEVKDRFGKNQYFDFRVKVRHSDGRVESKVVTAKAGSSVTVGRYTWTNDEAAPTYEVEEISTPSNGSWSAKSVEPSSGTLSANQTITVTAVNQIKYKRNKIQISKTVSSPAEKDETFKFSVDVTMPNGRHDVSTATIVVKQGQTTGNVWTSKEYRWSGKDAPTYEISEIETEDSKKYTPSITPSKGTLNGNGSVIKVNALNGSAMSYLTVEKALKDGQTTDDTFDFRITVNGVKNTDSGIVEFEVYGVKAGEKIGPYGFEWKDANVAPTYTVEEINLNSASVSTIEETVNGKSRVERNTNKITGQLVKGETTNLTAVKFTNDMTQHSGNLKVIKNFFSSEKMTAEELKELANQLNVKFDVEVTISGTFMYNGETIQNSSKVIRKTLSAANGWEFTINNIVWYGEETPTYTVKEVSLPDKWVCRSIDYSYTENESTDTEGHNLLDGGTVEITIVNEIPSDTEIDLTFEMAGLVWVDGILDQKNDDEYYNSPNGVYDEGEPLKENAEVTIYKVIYDASGNVVERSVATAYQDDQDNEITFPIITKSDGKWDVPRIGVPGVEQEGYSASYDVEFAYDGQTYETTTFLATANGDGASFKNATTAGKKAYENNSMAIEVSNNSKNIAEVSGKTAINANGDTTGYVGLTDGTQAEISYSSANAGTGYPTISRLNTSNPYDGRVLDLFKATATTSEGGLTFPFDVDGYDGSALTEVNKTIDDTGFHTKYKFLAVYNYCLHINLGLKEREVVDVGLTKNLTQANVVVNERMYQYKYSGLYDLTEEKLGSLSKDIYVGNHTEEIEYTLGLYQSDYYYRAEMYKNNPDLYDRLEDFYAKLNKDLSDTELDIYLTYEIKIKNTSPIYEVQINSLDDYYDSSFTLIRNDETKYLKTQIVDGKESDVNGIERVAKTSYYVENGTTERKINWTIDRKIKIPGSDTDGNGNNIIYNKMTANDLGIVLAPGESKELTLTFKVNKDKDTISGKAIEDSIILGQKCNVAEIANYSVFDQGTKNYAGRIDRDSAPSNVNLPVYNTKAWYEDDTFAAPRIKVNLVGENVDRNINGVVWEDNSNGDARDNQENPGYNQWVGNGKKDSGEKEIESLTTNLVQKVAVKNPDESYTEYDYIWPTEEPLECLNGATLEEITGFDTTIETDNQGEYRFQNVIAGDYVVRFIYGNKKIDSAGYSLAKSYNGQDYKSAKFNGKLENDETTLKADSYLNINNYLNADESGERVNTAIDSEIERLKVVEKSREITYKNSAVMADFNENSDLYKDYTMFADTPKIDMNIELPTYGSENYTYTVKNVDFGLEERPITELTLDQQIEEIILTTSDGNNIMDAKYTIDYEVDENGKITANVELDSANSYGIDNLQALNRDQATTHGFRYISIDTSILEGTTITVKYRFTVLNAGEVDRTGELANMVYAEDNTKFPETIGNLATAFSTYHKDGNALKNDTALGKYLGNIYYYGVGESDAVVTSTLRQVVDYVDNNVVFSGNLNNFENSSWSNITTEELKGHIDEDIVQNNMIVDSKGIQYETQNRNNLIVSVDSTESTLNNKDFIIELQPYAAAIENDAKYKAAMNLTVTKYVASDSDDLQINNIAEIIKYNNKVGRHDELAIVGNQNPANALEKQISLMADTKVSSGMRYERDTTASEMITLSPPFGSGLATWKLQTIATITVSLLIVAGGIVVIKKKILK